MKANYDSFKELESDAVSENVRLVTQYKGGAYSYPQVGLYCFIDMKMHVVVYNLIDGKYVGVGFGGKIEEFRGWEAIPITLYCAIRNAEDNNLEYKVYEKV